MATVFLSVVVNYLNMLVQVAVFLVTERTGLFFTAHRNTVHRLLVGVQDGFLIEHFIAEITRVQALGLLHGLISTMLSFDVFVKVGELVVTEGTRLPDSQVNHSLVSRQVIFLGKCFQTNIANMF